MCTLISLNNTLSVLLRTTIIKQTVFRLGKRVLFVYGLYWWGPFSPLGQKCLDDSSNGSCSVGVSFNTSYNLRNLVPRFAVEPDEILVIYSVHEKK